MFLITLHKKLFPITLTEFLHKQKNNCVDYEIKLEKYND